VSERLVLCIGNPDRGDDGVGWLVADRLRAQGVPAGMRVETLAGGAAELIAAFEGEDDVVLVDAACSGAPAGTVHVADCAMDEALPTAATGSSHGLGVAEAIALARALGCLPRRCVVYAIEGRDFAPGGAVAGAAAAAADATAARISAWRPA
jgi:hydrogenase maturation protease